MNASLHSLATFLCDVEFNDLPAELQAHATKVVADLVAAITAGMREPEMTRLAAALAPVGSAGPCTVIGHGSTSTPETAALLHGTAGTFLEVDEGNRFSRGHPGIHVLPAALAIAQQRGASGAALLAAFVAGYEVSARIGSASQIRASMHPHGTWGTVGAAVAVRKLLGGGVAEMTRAINIASTLGLATSIGTMREGGTVRNAYAGVSGKLGLLANQLVDCGFSAEQDGLRSVYGGVISEGFCWDRMLDGLGDRWEIGRNYFKLHACCRFNHAALDALQTATAGLDRAILADSVEAIEVHTYALAAKLSDPCPTSPLAARYSLPFAIATALVHGSTDVQAFSHEAVANKEVLRLARKVQVHEDPVMTGQLPGHRPARVRLRLVTGEDCVGSVKTNKGDAEDPYSETELEAKFMRLMTGSCAPSEATRLWKQMLSLGSNPDASALFKLEAG